MDEKLFLRWALADHAFVEAWSLAKVLYEHTEIEQGSGAFAACMTGIATCYYRPFMSAGGLGKVPDEILDLGKFDGLPKSDILKKAHQMLWVTRVKLGGHIDLKYLEQLYAAYGNPESPSSVTIRDNPPDGLLVLVNILHMEYKALPAIIMLCQLQVQRVQQRMVKFREEIIAERGKVGEFTISGKE